MDDETKGVVVAFTSVGCGCVLPMLMVVGLICYTAYRIVDKICS